MTSLPDLQPPWLEALSRPEAYPHPAGPITLLQTHISWVFLTGDWAYKLKKPVQFNFLDFSTLEKRHAACQEELRLNRRTAPSIYDSVVPLVRTAGGPRWNGEGETLEYAVRMRQFPQSDLLLERMQSGSLTVDHVEALGIAVARLHQLAGVAGRATNFGSPAVTHRAVTDCFAVLDGSDFRGVIADLRSWTDAEALRLGPHFEARRQAGFIRECHGDLHLGNLVLIDGVPTLFDALEFNEELRWIDVVSDLAFLVMDLHDHGAPAFAWQVLNTWLEQTGDFAGLAALRYFLVYRAIVRAKVAALRLGQRSLPEAERSKQAANVESYLALAKRFSSRETPALVLMHGLSGSGKTHAARSLTRERGGIHCRSDVERKRLLGAWPPERVADVSPSVLYSAEATARTYDRLLEVAAAVLDSGHTVYVDAAFLRASDRRRFADLARSRGAAFRIVSCTAPSAVLESRVRNRLAERRDASDATLDVLRDQRQTSEPLSDEERRVTVEWDSDSARS